mmetsp:Transcript_2967/g.7391  ORF Transcript_2967/g.7391 Transcript_2967/m.7391 type:complete len:84 (-) Transcript_2967:113-364(-)
MCSSERSHGPGQRRGTCVGSDRPDRRRQRPAAASREQLYADYLIFMRRLSEEASRLAASQGDRRVTEEHIDAVADRVLREFRG